MDTDSGTLIPGYSVQEGEGDAGGGRGCRWMLKEAC